MPHKLHLYLIVIILANSVYIYVANKKHSAPTLENFGTSSTVNELDSQNDLVFLRVRIKKYEIMVAPDHEYMLIVIQNPDEE